MHIAQAILLMTSPAAVHATSMTALIDTFHAVGSPDGIYFMAAFMLVSAALALLGTFTVVGWFRLATYLPQHIILGVMTIGATVAAFEGRYLDGTVKPWQHIITDQMILIALFVIHSTAILRRAQESDDQY